MKRFISVVALSCLAASCTNSGSSTTTPATSSTAAPSATTATSTTAVPEAATIAASPSSGANTEEVSFASGDLELVGTLRLPGAEDVPGVVLIHGSGPNSRDETAIGQLNMTFGFEIPIFAEIGDALQQAGFAVLTYDKRTCGQFNGCAENNYPVPSDDILVDDFIADAQAAVAYLRARPEVDPDRISVVGHSQGAEFVPVMLLADPSLASGAMLAGPYQPIDQIMEFQYTSTLDLLEALGLTEEQALATPGVAELSASVDEVLAIRDGSDEAAAGVSAAFWRSWFDLADDRIASVGDLSQPVLILQGSFDWNVPPGEAEAWDQLFSEAGKEHTTVMLDCVTHALNCVTGTDIMSISPADIGEGVSGDVTNALIDFLSG